MKEGKRNKAFGLSGELRVQCDCYRVKSVSGGRMAQSMGDCKLFEWRAGAVEVKLAPGER